MAHQLKMLLRLSIYIESVRWRHLCCSHRDETLLEMKTSEDGATYVVVAAGVTSLVNAVVYELHYFWKYKSLVF